MENNVLLVFSTFADEASAGRAGRRLVEERLAACVNLQPGIRSIYRWQGTLQEDTECLLIAKTSQARVDALTERLAQMHDYELPEVVAVPVTAGLNGYLRWVADECVAPDAGAR
jgi:periplasmic divalent cation tolerance protein